MHIYISVCLSIYLSVYLSNYLPISIYANALLAHIDQAADVSADEMHATAHPAEAQPKHKTRAEAADRVRSRGQLVALRHPREIQLVGPRADRDGMYAEHLHKGSGVYYNCLPHAYIYMYIYIYI